METLADHVIYFNKKLHCASKLPKGFKVLNPFRENPETMQVMQEFYRKFYNDEKQRKFIIGINPGRHGAGLTGIPFTDTKRLDKNCSIQMKSDSSYEVSSVFIYDVIKEYGGVEKFYASFYINSPFPLAIVRLNPQGKWLNANYYDDPLLFEAVKPFMIKCLRQQIAFGLNTKKVFVLGKKNELFLSKINKEEKLFEQLVSLEHPRFIQQYKSRQREEYIQKYLALLDA